MDGVTVDQCQTAIKLLSPELMQLPGVQGLGVSQPSSSEPNEVNCKVIIYVDSAQHAEGLPQELRYPEGKRIIRIPTTISVIGTVKPE